MRARSVLRSLLLAAVVASGSRSAFATLTPSEGAIVKQFVGTAQIANAGKVRALVARPDLTEPESSQAMIDALAPLAFTEARAVFLRELVFGGASGASRNILVTAAVKGLLARADTVFGKGTPETADIAEELLRVYKFLGADVANAGRPTGRLHDAQAGITPGTYEACAKLMAEHFERHALWLKGGPSQLATGPARVRAQASLALLDMQPDTPTKNVDAAIALGLDTARRAILVERGLLILDSGKADGKIPEVQSMLRRIKGGLEDIEAFAFDEAPQGLKARGTVLAISSTLENAKPSRAFPEDEVTQSPVSAPIAALGLAIAERLTRQVLANRGDLRLAAQRDLTAAGTDKKRVLGTPTEASPEGAVASALGLLLVDAPRTLDVAMARFLSGHPESASLVSDALGVLAASAAPANATQFALGKGESDGTSSILDVNGVRLAPSGAALAFAVGPNRWELTRDITGTGVVSGVKRDGQPLAFPMLGTARIPITTGSSWTGGGISLMSFVGAPEVGVVAGPRIRMAGTSDLDGAVMAGPGDDVIVEADVKAEGPSAILVRAVSGRAGFGVGVRITPGPTARATLVTLTSTKVETPIGALLELPSIDHVRLAIKGENIEVSVSQRLFGGTLGAPKRAATTVPGYLHGDVAFLVKKDSTMELSNLSVKKN